MPSYNFRWAEQTGRALRWRQMTPHRPRHNGPRLNHLIPHQVPDALAPRPSSAARSRSTTSSVRRTSESSSTTQAVNGHLKVPTGGHEKSPPIVTKREGPRSSRGPSLFVTIGGDFSWPPVGTFRWPLTAWVVEEDSLVRRTEEVVDRLRAADEGLGASASGT